eukprot:Seg3407.1 transcript_id=Seg3407.1/GoldUCD/mRNA.D3Y31 product="hypothetical protein" protein_id=Seg3407.1/GoldUCD/D3Y31
MLDAQRETANFPLSSTHQKGLDIHLKLTNKPAVLASRNIGVGHEGLVKFTAAINMPPPMNANAYTDSVKHLKEAAKYVAEKSMLPQLQEFQEDQHSLKPVVIASAAMSFP